MDAPSLRNLTTELADDLGWLEAHCRRQPHLAERAGELRLAAALVRNVVGPFLDGQQPRPLHVAVVGGAGAGKSTIVNFLCGAGSAEANPQAGFTRHPVAYTHVGTAAWPSQYGFLGPLHRLDQPAPSSLDEDVYQVRELPVAANDGQLLADFVVWDCPDMTTWAAATYASRLIEVSGLADVIVYVASDERYNDAVPTEFLRLLLEVGKPVVVCLTKMRPETAPALIKHFQDEVLKGLPRGRVTTLAIPHLSPDELANPVARAGQYRIPLLNQLMVLGDPAPASRRRNVKAALRFLTDTCERLLAVARDDVAALEEWRALVVRGRDGFTDRYRREFLTSEKFRRFDEALVRLIELMELPGVGKFVSGTLWVVRTPYRLLKGAMNKAFSRPDVASLPEQQVLDAGLNAWLDQLRAEALRRSGQHSLWKHVAEGFDEGLGDRARERFQQGFRALQADLTAEVERTARAIYEELEKAPGRLNALRGSKFALDIVAITSALTIGHIGLHDLILVPLSAAVSQQLVEWLGAAYVETQREQARTRQQALVVKHLAEPLSEWLAQWPATGGTAYERIQLALSRVPNAIRDLGAAVRMKTEGES
jgi:GTPase SAR1 family protein